jgi:hypothetical protein
MFHQQLGAFSAAAPIFHLWQAHSFTKSVFVFPLLIAVAILLPSQALRCKSFSIGVLQNLLALYYCCNCNIPLMIEKLNFGFYPIYGPLTDICHMVWKYQVETLPSLFTI